MCAHDIVSAYTCVYVANCMQLVDQCLRYMHISQLQSKRPLSEHTLLGQFSEY